MGRAGHPLQREIETAYGLGFICGFDENVKPNAKIVRFARWEVGEEL